MGNPFVHIELNTNDAAKAKKFSVTNYAIMAGVYVAGLLTGFCATQLLLGFHPARDVGLDGNEVLDFAVRGVHRLDFDVEVELAARFRIVDELGAGAFAAGHGAADPHERA